MRAMAARVKHGFTALDQDWRRHSRGNTMTRRLLLLATLMTLGLTGCVTYSDSYYRQSQYRDGGYYYPARDGYGDYYQGREQVQYVDYYYSSYTPFWGLSRYYCAGYYSCSPFWNSYYGRPYSGWNLAFGSHYSYGRWGWYGNNWAPWAGPGYYGHRPHRPDPNHRPPGTPPGPRDPYVDDSNTLPPGSLGANAGWPGPTNRNEEPPGYRPGHRGNAGGPGPGPVGGEPAPGPRAAFPYGGKQPVPAPGEDAVRPMPRSNFGKYPGMRTPEPGTEPAVGGEPGALAPDNRPLAPRQGQYRPGGAPREYRQPAPREDYRNVPAEPAYREEQRYEPREVERYEPREVERYEPREVERYEPRDVERYEPREVERFEPEPRPEPMQRPEPMEMSGPSQFESRSDEQ
jgi:hypothetical protein